MIYKKRNKYGAIKQTYNGYSYHSKKEASYAAELDLRKKAKDIKDWKRQVKVEFNINGIHICNYFVDFVIIHNDGNEEWVEVKGFMTNIGLFKTRMFKALYPKRKFTIIR